MEDYNSCRTFSREHLKTLRVFLEAHPHVLNTLPRASQNDFIRLCAYVAHLRSRKAIDFFMSTLRAIESIGSEHDIRLILNGATTLGARNWVLVLPYFVAAKHIPNGDDFFEAWLQCSQRLADRDIDVAVTFLHKTPGALSVLGREAVLRWGELARNALKNPQFMWKAARAYLEESVENRCGTTPERWVFNLEQASIIAQRSPSAAEEFIRSGSRICLLLNEEETARWVQEGITGCSSTAELASYFSGSSLKSLDTRDALIQGETLKDRIGSLSLICQAYLARPVKIRSNRGLVGVKGFSFGPVTDGRVIYLPEVVHSFELMKLMALHQATLLNIEGWHEALKDSVAWPADIHVEADRKLIEIFPGMARLMRRIAGPLLSDGYPHSGHVLPSSLPWWGDLLPHLISETEATVRKIKDGLPDASDLPPELIEKLVDSLLAQGEREPNALLAKLGLMLDNIDFDSPDAEDLGENVQTFFYKEWDSILSDYKLDWCLVRQWTPADDPNSFARNLAERRKGIISLIRRQFTKLKPERFRKFKAQNFGDELDLDALINAIVEMRSGSFLSDKVYIRRDKRVRDVAVLFLVDLSASTEQELDGVRFLDIEKEAMTLMAEALDSLGDPFAIYGFSSEGRFRVDMLCLKKFNEPYGDSVRHRMGNLEPRTLTRLGTIIRHGMHVLKDVAATNKLMILLTDGRPYDIEYGNLEYAMADTRKAIKEARSQKIHPFIITSDKKGVSYLKQICAQTQSIVLPRAEILPQVLPALYKRLTL
jgi:hypothetical protein